MTAGAWVRVAAWKECRALLPVWATGAGVAIAVLLAGYPWPPALNDVWMLARDVAPVVFGIVPILLGAQAIGHEFSNRTLGTLLTQPVARSRLFVVKIAVLSGAVLSAGVLSFFAYGRLKPAVYADLVTVGLAEFLIQPLILIPLLGGLVLAPWLTLVTRTPLGGVVLSLAVPALALAGALLVRWLQFGTPETLDESLQAAHTLDTSWVAIMITVAAIGAWRLPGAFVRTEVRNGTSVDVTGLRWRRSIGTEDVVIHRRGPYSRLLVKELHLQVPTFVLVALFVLLWGLTALATRPESEVFQTYQVFFAALIPLLAGALATADERDQGLLEGDAMLPLSPGRRYALKLFVILTISLVCIAGVTELLAWSTGHGKSLWFTAHGKSDWFDRRHAWLFKLSLPLFIASAAIYVSSVSRGALRTLVVAGAAAFVAFVMLEAIRDVVLKYVTRLHFWWSDTPLPRWAWFRGFSAVPRHLDFLPVVLVSVVAALAVWFAYRNQRFSDNNARRITLQVVSLMVFYLTSTALLEVGIRRW
jgi:hypothetical protein